MRFTVAAVGKPRDAALAAAIHEYEERAARYWPLTVVEVKEDPIRGRTPAEARRRDAERLRAAVPKGSVIWLCEQEGKARSSEEFAQWMQNARESARDTALLIGGAFGLDESLHAGAAGVITFGPMTFPHELARLILAEQLYRAGTIVRGEPYHK